MVRHTDLKMIGVEEDVITARPVPYKQEAWCVRGAIQRSSKVKRAGRERNRGGFCGKEWARQGGEQAEQVQDWLV